MKSVYTCTQTCGNYKTLVVLIVLLKAYTIINSLSPGGRWAIQCVAIPIYYPNHSVMI